MKISLRQLELFLAISQHGNVTHAAKSLYISQSAASMALSELELQLDMLLFDRRGKKLVLNGNGDNLLISASDIIERVKEIENSAKSSSKELMGSLKIGASTTVGNYLIPKVIKQFLKIHPKIKIKLDIANTEQIVNKLLKFHIDIAFIEAPCEESDIISTTWENDKLIFFSSPNYWLAKKNKFDLENLLKADWILREQGSGTRRIFEKAVYPLLNSAIVTLELGSAESIKQAVLLGLGISCLSKHTVEQEIANGDLVELPIKIFDINRNFYRLLHKEKYQTKILTAFQEISSNIKHS